MDFKKSFDHIIQIIMNYIMNLFDDNNDDDDVSGSSKVH